ncbi:MAG: hypothetical protein AB7P04_14995 [Bacteriovoracia bacterium]
MLNHSSLRRCFTALACGIGALLLAGAAGADMKFISVKGAVTTEYSGKKSEVKAGSPLQFGDRIVGEAGSVAILQLPYEDVALQGPFDMLLQANGEVKELAEIQLNFGKLRARFKNLPANKKMKYRPVKTPVAVMGVRGTDFFASYEPGLGETETICFEHEIDFGSTTRPFPSTRVKAGQWGGLGGRFGDKIRKPMTLKPAFLEAVKAQFPLE